MKHKKILFVFVLLSAQVLNAGSVVEIVKQSGIKGGIVVHLN